MSVRREAVELDLIDNFSGPMLRNAAATKAFEGALRDLDGTSVSTGRSLDKTSKDTDRLSTSAVRGSRSIDQFSGRLGIMLRVAGALGPALVPIGAVGAAGVAALASQFGFLSVGISSVVIAAQGVGTALEAVNKANIEPTVANLQAARDALKDLDPAAQAFVQRFQEFRPVLADIRNSAAAGFFPGLTESLDDFERVAPKIGEIMGALGAVGGNLMSDAAQALAGPEWQEFMRFIAREAPPAFETLGRSVGNVAAGMAHLWQAFDPLSDGLSNWLLDASRGFEEWSRGLAATDGFQEFVHYAQENGPKVAEAVVAISNAFLQIAEAAAPLGGPVLEALTGMANAIADIADSPLGTPIMAAVTAMSALSIATNVATTATLRLKAAQASLGMGGGAAAGAAGFARFGGIITLAGFLGADMAKHLTENFVAVASGGIGLSEASDVVATWSNPFTAAAAALGFDILPKIQQPFLKAAIATTALADGLDDATASTRRYRGAMFAVQREQLQTARQSERLQSAIQDQRAAIHESASSWFDYSQKVHLGVTSMDDLVRRWRKLGEAAKNEAKNIQTALERGIDPKVIRNIINTLGPQGAVLAIDQLAHASRSRAKEIEAAFGVMSGGAGRFRGSLADVYEAITGDRAALKALNGQKAEPKADLDDSGLRGGVESAERLLSGLNGRRADTYIYVHTIRTGNDTAGGPAPLGSGIAGGGTIPGRRYPYADSFPAVLAPGEEVISNRYGQADRHRALLKEINANRFAAANAVVRSRASERPMSSSNSTTVRHVFEHRVTVTGALDARQAVAELRQEMHAVSNDAIDQDHSFEVTQR